MNMEIKCLRCGEPYETIVEEGLVTTIFEGHICSFDKEEENNPFESGVVGKPTIKVEDAIWVRDTYEHIIAGAHNNNGSKRLVVNMGKQFKVYHNNDCVHHSYSAEFATYCYNEINLVNL